MVTRKVSAAGTFIITMMTSLSAIAQGLALPCFNHDTLQYLLSTNAPSDWGEVTLQGSWPLDAAHDRAGNIICVVTIDTDEGRKTALLIQKSDGWDVREDKNQ